uniref:Uncharacterized protein n=1 Tax=Ixodes ricinus TaxID=34613 RepID=A0A6B0UX91_IXORI
MAVLVVMSVVPPMSSTMVTRYVEPHIHCVCTVAFKVFVRVTRVRREGPRILWRLILVSGLHLFRLLPRSHTQRQRLHRRRLAHPRRVHGGRGNHSTPRNQRKGRPTTRRNNPQELSTVHDHRIQRHRLRPILQKKKRKRKQGSLSWERRWWKEKKKIRLYSVHS